MYIHSTTLHMPIHSTHSIIHTAQHMYTYIHTHSTAQHIYTEHRTHTGQYTQNTHRTVHTEHTHRTIHTENRTHTHRTVHIHAYT